MKAKYLSMAALALMGALASCQSDDEVTVARPDNAVSVNFSVGSLQGTTRSNPASTDLDEARIFNLGDQVCVSTDGQDPVLFQCTNADQQTWAEAVPGKFLLWTQNEMTFKAYYPATEGTSMTAFTLPADQSSTEKIALADYMTRQQTCNNESSTDISLNLERKMARVIIRISGFGSQYDDDEKTVSNVSIYSEASGIADGNPTGSSTEIQPYAQGNGGQGSTYTALVVPGYGDSGARFIKLTDGEYNTLLVKGIPELEAGNSYTFNLVVGKNRIEVASVTVQDWTTGETLDGGQAEEGSAKAPAVTPNIAQADCTFSPSNGKSTLSNANITTSMEYSTDGGTTWTDVTTAGSIASLAAGTVQIRVKETDEKLASEAVSITVPEVLHINELVGPYTGDRLTCEYYAGETWQALVDRYDLIKVYSGRAAFGSDGFIYDESGSAVSVTALVDNTKTYEVQ